MLRFDGEAMAAGLGPWVECESPTYERLALNRMADLVVEAMTDDGIGIERWPGRDGLGDMLLVRAGPANGQKPVVVLSHLDTVHPMGTLARDLPLTRDGDRLYGPGIYDMKGGAFLAATAFRAIARAGTARRPMVFLFTPDEEIGSPTSRATIEAEARDAEAVLVTEPARDGGRIVTARKGVGRFEVDIEGRPAHSGSRHQDGRSAINEAARQILAVDAMTDYARGVTTSVAMMRGGTAMNVIPHRAWFSIDLRVATVADGLALEQAIHALKPQTPDVTVTVKGGMNRPPMEKSAGIEVLLAKAKVIAHEIGFVLEDVPMTGGGSDGNFTAAMGVPTLDGLGVDGDGAHTLGEYALVSSLAPRAALFARLLETL